jgi:hypothetical protein
VVKKNTITKQRRKEIEEMVSQHAARYRAQLETYDAKMFDTQYLQQSIDDAINRMKDDLQIARKTSRRLWELHHGDDEESREDAFFEQTNDMGFVVRELGDMCEADTSLLLRLVYALRGAA